MKSFSLDKIKSKVGRRFSESVDLDPTLSASSHRRYSSTSFLSPPDTEDFSPTVRFRASSLSIHQDGPAARSRSRSVSRKQAMELIHQETSQVIQKKLFGVLEDLGLQVPIPMKTSAGNYGSHASRNVQIYIANTHDCIYLPPSLSTSNSYEDAENGGNMVPQDDLSSDNLPSDGLSDSTLSADGSRSCLLPGQTANPAMNVIKNKLRSFRSANYLTTQIDSQTLIPHLSAIIVELKNDVATKSVEVNLLSVVSTQWPASEIDTRHTNEERFKIGNLDWNLSFAAADFFISTKNSNETKFNEVAPEQLAHRTREYVLSNRRGSLDQSQYFVAQGERSSMDSAAGYSEPQAENQKAGIYVFLLPVLLPAQIPATVNTLNGSLTHKINVKLPRVVEKSSKKSKIKASYNIPMVRTPPSLANSVADKPIYVNRTWNDALHYAITFPRKYVAIGCEHTINVKLVPLVKDVIVKRIKFNILERCTYASKDLTREYDFDGFNSYSKSKSSKTKDRVVPLCELKTKAKTSMNAVEPFKEEIIACPDNNLLFSCYEQPLSRQKSNEDSVMVASPLDISVALPFLTSKMDKEGGNGSNELESVSRATFSNPTSRKSSISRMDSMADGECPSSPVIGALDTHISHMSSGRLLGELVDDDVLKLESSSLLPRSNQDRHDSLSKSYTALSKALSPDSNFRHIQISHRLQVCFRISKPDPADNNKMHHYEVVVDTPLVLLSAKCNDSAIQLPKYDDVSTTAPISAEQPSRPAINFRTPSYIGKGVSIRPLDHYGGEDLPTFEEATSTPNSPLMRSASVTSLDPTTPAGPAPAYENVSAYRSDSIEPFSIDDVLIDTNNPRTHRKESSIHASLQNSFAPSMSTSSLNLKLVNDPQANEQESGSGEDDDSSSDEALSHVQTSSTGDDGLLTGLSSEAQNDYGEDKDSLYQKQFRDLQVDETQSIITQDTHFDQKLPLLRNASANDVGYARLTRQMSDKIVHQMLTESLNDDPLAQSLFHAY